MKVCSELRKVTFKVRRSYGRLHIQSYFWAFVVIVFIILLSLYHAGRWLYKKDVGRPLQVIILTSFRSGSTLTGELLSHYPNSFYSFEPLWVLDHMMKTNSTPRFFDDTTRSPYSNEGKERTKVQLITSLLDCQFHPMPQQFFTAGFSSKTKQNVDFNQCQKTNRDLKERSLCLSQLIQSCITSSIRVVKTIRLRMTSVEEIIQHYPPIKILHLIRDPRGQVLSVRHTSPGTFEELTLRTCGDVNSDIRERSRMERKYPETFKQIVYEDLAVKPMETAREIYRFLGLDFPVTVQDWLIKSTSGREDDGYMGTTRVNSTLTAFNWLKTLRWQDLQLIQSFCSDIINWLKFPIVESRDQLENFPIPSSN